METLLALAPVAALLAAFAYWIDRQNGRRIDDLRDTVGRRVDDLAAANREAHALIGQRIDEQGKRIDEQGRQLAQRIDEQERRLAQRIDAQGKNLRGDVDKLHALLLAIVPRAAAADDDAGRRPRLPPSLRGPAVPGAPGGEE